MMYNKTFAIFPIPDLNGTSLMTFSIGIQFSIFIPCLLFQFLLFLDRCQPNLGANFRIAERSSVRTLSFYAQPIVAQLFAQLFFLAMWYK